MSSAQTKTVLVTGCARGIGRVIAREFAQTGFKVVLSDRAVDLLSDVVAEFRERKFAFDTAVFDLLEPAQIRRAIQEIYSNHDALDCVVHNARAGKRARFLEETVENWDLTFNVGLRAAFVLAQEWAKSALKNGQKKGAFVNISSVAANMVCKESASYHASKAGLSHLSRFLSVNLAEVGQFRCNAILPGFIIQDEHIERFNSGDNKLYRGIALSLHPNKKMGRSVDVARLAVFLCSDHADFINGDCIIVDGGVSVLDQSTLLFKQNNLV